MVHRGNRAAETVERLLPVPIRWGTAFGCLRMPSGAFGCLRMPSDAFGGEEGTRGLSARCPTLGKPAYSERGGPQSFIFFSTTSGRRKVFAIDKCSSLGGHPWQPTRERFKLQKWSIVRSHDCWLGDVVQYLGGWNHLTESKLTAELSNF